jgi:acetyl-CoA carboxylase biotin carboxyl carrier protein
MEKQEIYELMDRFSRSGLTAMKWTEGEFSLSLEKAPAAQSPAPTAASQAAPAAGAAEELPVVKAPLVGTFYRSASKDEEPYVRPGDRVKKGSTLGLIEAMKTMSEIPAPCDLIVEGILAENGALVAFGEPIVRYRHV